MGGSPRFGHRNHVHCQLKQLGVHQVGPQSLIFYQRLERHEHVPAPESKPAYLGFVSLEALANFHTSDDVCFVLSIFVIFNESSMGFGGAREIYNLPCSPDVIAMAITCTMLFTWARCISRGESASPPQRLAADSVARACVACGLGFRVWGLGFMV